MRDIWLNFRDVSLIDFRDETITETVTLFNWQAFFWTSLKTDTVSSTAETTLSDRTLFKVQRFDDLKSSSIYRTIVVERRRCNGRADTSRYAVGTPWVSYRQLTNSINQHLILPSNIRSYRADKDNLVQAKNILA